MMKLFIALVAAAVMVIPSVASANLLGDAGFEGSGNGPWIDDNWGSEWTWNYDATDQVRSGSQSFKVSAVASPDTWELAGTKQNLAISAGQNLDASGYIKASNISGTLEAYMEAIFKDSLGGELGGKLQSTKITSNTDWTALTVTGAAPTGAASVDIRYIVGAFGSGQTASGDFWYDDTTAAIPEPTSLLLLGTGLVGLLGFGRKKLIK